MSNVHNLGMDTARLAQLARHSTPEECAATIEVMGNTIDQFFLIMQQAGVAPSDRGGLVHQLAVVMAACAKMKSALKDIGTAVGDLREAQAFLASCEASREQAMATGAFRDAHDWIKNAQAGLQVAAVKAASVIGVHHDQE